MTEEQVEDTASIGERVRAHRRREGLSQALLGERVGRSAQWVDRLEHGQLDWIVGLEAGRVDPDEVPVLADLGRVLGVSVEELVSGSAPRRPGSPVPPPALLVPTPPAAAPAAPAPAPLRRAPATSRRPAMPVRLLAAGAGIGVAASGVVLGLGRVTAPPTSHAAAPVATAVRVAGPPPTAVPLTPTALPSPSATPTPVPPTAAPTPAPTLPPRRPPMAPPRPVARVAVATPTPIPQPPPGVSVFPSRVVMMVPANSQSGTIITFSVSNPGSAGLTLGALSLSNPAFQGVRDGCSHATLAPRATCYVSLQMRPSPPGRYLGALVIPVTGGTTTTVPLEVDAR